ncbi:AGAP002444-PA [Kappamyces sp. JEL0680]|nr:AGAP002444-PA [Kappamyces sp. JEL0680]
MSKIEELWPGGIYGIVPYESSVSFPSVVLTIPLAFLGLVGNLLVLLGAGESSSPSVILIMSMCLGDFMLCSISFVLALWNASSGGWASGPAGCITDFLVLFVMAFVSVASLFAIAVERYLSVVREIRISRMAAMVSVGAIWFFAALASVIPFFAPQTIAGIVGLESSRLICMFLWKSDDPWTMIAKVVAISFLTAAIAGIALCYYHVYRHVKLNYRPSQNSAMSGEEYRVLKMLVVLTSAFFLCWSVYLAMVCYETISKQQSTPLFSATATLLVLTNSIINPIFLAVFDNRVRPAVLDLLQNHLWFVFADAPSRKASQDKPNRNGMELFFSTPMDERDQIKQTTLEDKEPPIRVVLAPHQLSQTLHTPSGQQDPAT